MPSFCHISNLSKIKIDVLPLDIIIAEWSGIIIFDLERVINSSICCSLIK